MTLRKIGGNIAWLAISLFAILVVIPAWSQDFPAKTIRFIVPFPPGGGADIVSRLLARNMETTLGQHIIVENMPGAAGAIGLAALARSTPDGYTMGWGGLGPTVLVHIVGPKPQYKPDQLEAFARTGAFHYAVVARADFPYKTMSEIIAAAKEKPNSITYATSGSGGPVQLAFEVFKHSEGISLREVPFKGDPESLLELLAGRIDLGVISVPVALSQIKEGKIKAIAVPTDRRLPFLPDVPTTRESGAPGFICEAVGLLLVPSQTPRPVVERLNKAANIALSKPDIQAKFEELGLVAEPINSVDAPLLIDQLIKRWTGAIEQAKIPIPK